MSREKRIDKQFLLSVAMLLIAGLFIFFSASMGLLARSGAKFSDVALKQIMFGLIPGIIVALAASKFNYKYYRKYSFYIMILSIAVTLLVFVPGIGMSHGGAKRWIILMGYSFQPSEFLKISFVIYMAAWMSAIKDKVSDFRFGLIPLSIVLVVCGAVLLMQPDTDTFIVMFLSSMAMFVTAGGKIRHLSILAVVAIIGLAAIAFMRPYVMERFTTFLDPSKDPTGAGYQIQQSLIAVGSGGIFGRGFGKSLQKFSYLPEPIGDSIFAVAAEEFGFFGSLGLIALFLYFAFRGLRISIGAPDLFGGLLALGIVILIISSSFINMASMLGVIPLSGLPLLFVSQGGTALLFALAEVGIVMNISRYRKV